MHTEQEQYEYMVSRGMKSDKAMAYARLNALQGVDAVPKCIVETAGTYKPSVDVSGAIQRYYEDCRCLAKSRNAVFVGD